MTIYIVQQGTAFETTVEVRKPLASESANMKIQFRLNGELDAVFTRGETIDDARAAVPAGGDMIAVFVYVQRHGYKRHEAIWRKPR